MPPHSLARATLAFLVTVAATTRASADEPLTWGLADGSGSWPAPQRDCITASMNEAVAVYNQYGHFDKHVTATYNPGVPTAQSNYDGWIEFGGSCNTRVAIHEIAHALGTGTYWPFDGAPWATDNAAGKLERLFDGQGAVLSTGGSHFWPYGMNYDNEDGPAARERHCKLLSAFRFDMGIVVDSDSDGLPDDWELFHFAKLDQGASGDPDGDGIENLDEYASDADPTQRSPIADGKTYVILNQVSGRALTLGAKGSVAGAELALHDVDRGPAQQWTVHYVGGGFHRISPAGSDLVIEVPGTDTASAIPLRLAQATGALQQQWRVVGGPGAEPDHFQISNHETGRVADGLDGADGAPVQQYPFLGNVPQQFWAFEKVGSDDDGAGDAGSDAGTSSDAVDAAVDTSDPGSMLGSGADAATSMGAVGEGAAGGNGDLDTGAGKKADASPGCSAGGSPRGDDAAWITCAVALVLLLVARTRRRRTARSNALLHQDMPTSTALSDLS